MFTLSDSVDHDEIPHSAVFLLGLHCLLKIILRGHRLFFLFPNKLYIFLVIANILMHLLL